MAAAASATALLIHSKHYREPFDWVSDEGWHRVQLVGVLALSAIALYTEARFFLIHTAVGFTYQVILLTMGYRRLPLDHEEAKCGECPPEKKGCDNTEGCASSNLKTFLGFKPYRYELIFGLFYGIVTHQYHHNHYITTSNLLGLCVGVRLANTLYEMVSTPKKPSTQTEPQLKPV